MRRHVVLLRPAAALLVAAAVLLAGCGFHLRRQANLPFDSIYINAPITSQFTAQLRRAITSGSEAQVVEEPTKAQAVLHVTDERQEKLIQTISGGGRVSEFLLRYRIGFRLTDSKGAVVYIPPSEIVMQRTFTYSDQEAGAKVGEEALLYRDMRQDAVQQMLRRLQAAKPVKR